MTKEELKAMLVEIAQEESGTQDEKVSQQMQQVSSVIGNYLPVGKVIKAGGATISGTLKIAGSLFEGVGHVVGTASDAVAEVGRSLKG